MFRALLSSRLIQVGLIFFVLVVGGSLLYSWQTRRTTIAEFAGIDVVPHETRSEQDTVDTSTVDFEQAGTPLEADDSQPMPDDTDVSPIDETSEMLEMADAFLPDDFVSEEAPTEDVPVSPYGFGPYPEVPDGFPQNLMPVWTWSEERQQEQLEGLKNFELMGRVLIKLWNQGDRDWRGAQFDEQNGRVYPLYRNRIYVTRWIEVPVEGGKLVPFPAGGSSGGSGWKPDIEAFVKSGGKLPGHIQFIDRDTAGYNPRDFLNLR